VAERLRCHVQRFDELVVNVTDLERTVAFYEENTPLRVHTRTDAPEQPFPALGIERGRFVGARMSDATSIDPGVSIHFVQWQEPRPIGAAYDTFFHAGYDRFCFQVADPKATYAALQSRGVQPFAPLEDRGVLIEGNDAVVSFTFPDPDGIAIHITRRPTTVRSDAPEQLWHVSPVVRDVERAAEFFETVLGLEPRIRFRIDKPAPAGYGHGGPLGQFDAVIVGHPGDRRFHVDLVDWVVPGVVGSPYAEPYHVGIQRLSFAVDDLDAAHAALVEALPAALAQSVRGPDTWDLGPAGLRRVVAFRTEDGLPLELVQSESRLEGDSGNGSKPASG